MRNQVAPHQEMDAMEQRLIRALETRPAAPIPPDFIARVMQQLPQQRSIPVSRTSYGRAAMLICMVLLGGVLLLTFAVHGMANAPAIRMTEWLLYAQFLGLVLWFGVRGEREID